MIRRALLPAVLVVAGAILLPPFYVSLLIYVALAALVAIGLVLLTGIGGLTSFGQAAFAGVAAYTTALLTHGAGWSPWLTLPVALLLVAASSLLIGLVTVRLSGHYIGLATMAWGTSAYYLMGTLPGLGEYNGIPEIVGLPGLSGDPRWMLLFVAALVAGAALLTHHLLHSRQGRAIRALAGGRLMAESMGVDTARVALGIFVIAAVFAGVSGWLYAHVQRFVNPSPFGLTAGIEYLFMVIIGGAGSLGGAVVGAAVVTLLRDQLNDWLPRLLGQPGNFEGMVFAGLVILALQRLPRGIVPWFVRHRAMRAQAGPAPVAMASGRPMQSGTVLSVSGVTRRFGGLVANEAVGFDVQAGQILALIGPNGAGKSTCFNMVGGQLRPDGGSVVLDGQAITGLGPRQVWRRGVGRTFQITATFASMTVRENVQMALLAAAGQAWRCWAPARGSFGAEAEALLDQVGLLDSADRGAGVLAYGDLKRLELALALSNTPRLLLMDEPTAGMAPAERTSLMALTRRLATERGLAVLFTEHDMDVVFGVSDRILVLNRGQVIAEGAPAAIRADARVREVYLGTGDTSGGH